MSNDTETVGRSNDITPSHSHEETNAIPPPCTVYINPGLYPVEPVLPHIGFPRGWRQFVRASFRANRSKVPESSENSSPRANVEQIVLPSYSEAVQPHLLVGLGSAELKKKNRQTLRRDCARALTWAKHNYLVQMVQHHFSQQAKVQGKPKSYKIEDREVIIIGTSEEDAVPVPAETSQENGRSTDSDPNQVSESSQESPAAASVPVKRKRGRPRKNPEDKAPRRCGGKPKRKSPAS